MIGAVTAKVAVFYACNVVADNTGANWNEINLVVYHKICAPVIVLSPTLES